MQESQRIDYLAVASIVSCAWILFSYETPFDQCVCNCRCSGVRRWWLREV